MNLVSGKDFKHLLGVLVALKETSEQMSEVVISDNIVGMSSNTTASNTC